MLITADGIVIRSYPVGDHDSVVHILTENHGRLPVMVKGSRSKRNCGESASCTQLFTYGNYELYRGKGEFYYLRNGSVLHSFYELSGDLARMALATYLCDVAAELTDEGVILLYYYEEMTLKEISLVLEVSESRVSQLHTKAIQKMRGKLGPAAGFVFRQ